MPEMVERFFEWARSTQRAEGYWEQRYWISGERGPGWCSFLDSIQIDQTGSMVFALGMHANRLPPTSAPASSNATGRWWKARSTISSPRWVRMACIPRRSICGKNSAAVSPIPMPPSTPRCSPPPRGRRSAGSRSRASWRQAAARIKAVLLTTCWNGRYFARGFDETGQLDWGLDSSILGIFDPFGMLSLDVPDERAMVESMVEVIRERLTKHLPDGEAIMRHEGDDYVDGSAGGVNTLWLARVMLHLAHLLSGARRGKMPQLSGRRRGNTCAWSSRARTSTGLLPELIGSNTTSRWAAPHGWAMASFIQCALLLNQLVVVPSIIGR